MSPDPQTLANRSGDTDPVGESGSAFVDPTKEPVSAATWRQVSSSGKSILQYLVFETLPGAIRAEIWTYCITR
jgi:hypothetical protein